MSNLVLNGSLASPVLGSSYVSAGVPTNWTVQGDTNSGMAQQSLAPFLFPSGYTQYYFLGITTANQTVTLSQSITFPSAGNYTISYWATTNHDDYPVGYYTSGIVLSMDIGGGVATNSTTFTSKINWTNYVVNFYVNSASTKTLTFTNVYNATAGVHVSAYVTGISIVKNSDLVLNGYFTTPSGGSTHVNITSSTNWSWNLVNTSNTDIYVGGSSSSTIIPTSSRPFNSGITQLLNIDNYTTSSSTNSGINQLITFTSLGNWVLSFWVCRRSGYNTAPVHTYRFQMGTFLDKSINNPDTNWNFYTIPFINTTLTATLTISTSCSTGYSLNSLLLAGVSIYPVSTISPFLLNSASGGSGSYDAILMSDMVPTVDMSNTKIGSASLAFNATYSHYAQMTNFSVPSTGLTISCWFKVSSVGNSRVFDFGNGQGIDNIAYSPNTGTLYYIGTTAYNIAAASGKADNTWHHFVWTMTFAQPFSNTSIHTVYIDNVVTYSSTSQYYPAVGSRTYSYLGRSNWTTDVYTTGNIDDFRTYSSVLSASDVNSLYYSNTTSTNGTMSYNLTKYYPFETSAFEWITNGYFTTSVSYGWNIEPYGWKSYAGASGTDVSGQIGIANTTTWTTNLINGSVYTTTPLPQGVTNFVWLMGWSTPTMSPGIYQDISFSSVGNYTLTFWASTTWSGSNIPLYIKTGSNTQTVTLISDTWTKYTVSFTVSSIASATRLTFYTNYTLTYSATFLSAISVVYASSITSTNTLLGTSVGNLASGNVVFDATLYGGASIVYDNYKVGSSCLALNASLGNQYVQVNNFVVTNQGLTFACWFKYTSAGWSRLFDFGNGTPSENILYSPGNGTSLFTGTTDTGIYAGSGKADGNWHHFVWTMTYASGATSTHTIYMDNVVIYTTSVKNYPTLGARTYCYIGKSVWAGDPYATGYIDDFRIYNGVLSANDVSNLYNSTSSISFSGNYISGLVNTTATTVYDASLNGGAYISTTNYITGTGALTMDTSGQFVQLNNSLKTGNALSFAFWLRGNSGCGQYTLLDYSNGSGGKNKITLGLQNNTLYSQVVNGTVLGTPTFANYTTGITAASTGIHCMCGISDGTRITYGDFGDGNIYSYVYANSAWSLSGTLSVGSAPVGVCCTADGSRLVISRRSGTLLYATWGGSAYVSATATGFGQGTSDGGVSMTPDGKILVLATGHTTGNNYIFFSVWNTSTNNYTTFTSVSTLGRWFGMDITPDGSRIAYTDIVANTAYYSVWNNATQTYGSQTAITTVNSSVRRIAFSKDGNLLFVGNNNATATTGFQYAIWNGTAFSSLTSFPSGVVPVSFDNTGIVIGWDNTVYLSQYGNSAILKFTFNVPNQYLFSNFYYDQNLNDNTWRHVVWTIDVSNTTYKYYLNGSLIKTDVSSGYTFPAQMTRTTNLLGTGTDLSLSYFIGGIDDYRVYNSVLTDTQVSDIYSGKVLGNSSTITELKNVFKQYTKGIQPVVDIKMSGNDVIEIFQPYTSGQKASTTGVYALRGGVLTDLCNLYQPISNIYIFTYTGADQTFIVPTGTSIVKIECWGAGGGTQGGGNIAAKHTGNGGGGGYTKALFSIKAGTSLTVIVGQGGQTGNNGANCVATYGGGGSQVLGDANWGSASGGGRSAVRITTGSVEIVTAGGGGGAGCIISTVTTGLSAGNGGGGGGLVGGDALSAFSNEGGKGGTQTAGGAVSTNVVGTAGSSGSQYTGGGGASYGAGAGGGYYGGGAGGLYDTNSPNNKWSFGGGGGGSSFIHRGYLYSGISSTSMVQATAPTVANGSGIPSAYTNTIGNGGTATNFNGTNSGGATGQNGLVIITCQ